MLLVLTLGAAGLLSLPHPAPTRQQGHLSSASIPGRLSARSHPVCCADDEEAPTALLDAAVLLPVAGCIVAGVPWFAAVYVPLVALSARVDAPSGAASLAASLIYSAGAALLDSSMPLFEVPAAIVSLAVLVLQVADGPVRERAAGEPNLVGQDPFASFDARLKERSSSRED